LAHKPVEVRAQTWTSNVPGAGRATPDNDLGDVPSEATGADARDAHGSQTSLLRRVGAGVTAVMLVALVGADLSVTDASGWWDRHSFTSCVVSSLLVLGATVLIVDEVVARRQRKERAVSVAVQSLIVYGQALRAYDVVAACPATLSDCGAIDAAHLDEMRDEVRSLANMVLVASPSLFDDPDARLFLEEVQRLVAAMYGAVARAGHYPTPEPASENAFSHLRICKSRARTRVAPLATRLPRQDSVVFDKIPDI
jgi:hypothetical protein